MQTVCIADGLYHFQDSQCLPLCNQNLKLNLGMINCVKNNIDKLRQRLIISTSSLTWKTSPYVNCRVMQLCKAGRVILNAQQNYATWYYSGFEIIVLCVQTSDIDPMFYVDPSQWNSDCSWIGQFVDVLCIYFFANVKKMWYPLWLLPPNFSQKPKFVVFFK